MQKNNINSRRTPINQLPVKYQTVLGVLRKGRENAQITSDLMKITQIKDARQFHAIIEQLIKKHGYCIGSCRYGDHRGYYFITDYFELMDTTTAIFGQSDSMAERGRSLIENFSEEDESVA